MQHNTLHFTISFSFKQAIILERSGLLWARVCRRKPENGVLSFNSQLLTRNPARTKPSKDRRKGAADSNHTPLLEEKSQILTSGGGQRFILPRQRPLPNALCALLVFPRFFILFRAENGFESRVPLHPAPWQLLLSDTLHETPCHHFQNCSFMFSKCLSLQHESLLLSNTW